MAHNTVLLYPDLNIIDIHTDASNFQLRAVIR